MKNSKIPSNTMKNSKITINHPTLIITIKKFKNKQQPTNFNNNHEKLQNNHEKFKNTIKHPT